MCLSHNDDDTGQVGSGDRGEFSGKTGYYEKKKKKKKRMPGAVSQQRGEEQKSEKL